MQYVGPRGTFGESRGGSALSQQQLSQHNSFHISAVSPPLFTHDALNPVIRLRVIINLNSKMRIQSAEVAVGQSGHQRVSSELIISPACNL